MKWKPSLDALFVLVFAACVLAAVLLLTGCEYGEAIPARGTPVAASRPLAQIVSPDSGQAD